jgi:hypothetical protein
VPGELLEALACDHELPRGAHRPQQQGGEAEDRVHDDAVDGRQAGHGADRGEIEEDQDPEEDPRVRALVAQQLEHPVDGLAELVATAALPLVDRVAGVT